LVYDPAWGRPSFFGFQILIWGLPIFFGFHFLTWGLPSFSMLFLARDCPSAFFIECFLLMVLKICC